MSSSSSIPSCPLFKQAMSDAFLNNKQIISLGLGEPCFDTPEEIKTATIEALQSGFTKYTNPRGLFELRDLIANKLLAENNIITDSDSVFITTGAKQALLVAFQALLEPGDEVIVIEPCFISFEPIIRIAQRNVKVVSIQLESSSFNLDLTSLKTAINSNTKAILLNFPHNPTGAILSNHELIEIRNIMMEYPNCFIVSDELYEYLVWDPFSHISIASDIYLASRVFTINGMSKAYAMTGWRIGFLCCPKIFRNKVSHILTHSNMNVTSFIQKGSCKCFSIDKAYLLDHMSLIRRNYNYLYDILSPLKFVIVKPKGGFFAFIQITHLSRFPDSDEYAAYLANRYCVAVSPGIQFGSKWGNYLRISLSVPSDIFTKGINLIKESISL